jgi:hypothetical protein
MRDSTCLIEDRKVEISILELGPKSKKETLSGMTFNLLFPFFVAQSNRLIKNLVSVFSFNKQARKLQICQDSPTCWTFQEGHIASLPEESCIGASLLAQRILQHNYPHQPNYPSASGALNTSY